MYRAHVQDQLTTLSRTTKCATVWSCPGMAEGASFGTREAFAHRSSGRSIVVCAPLAPARNGLGNPQKLEDRP
jgi:hypothetical protein